VQAPSRPRAWLLRIGVAALVAGALALAVRLAQRPADGPEEVPYDRVACARCGMLVGEASFAGQLHLHGGEVRFYDDPGCLLLHADELGAEVRAAWFHAHGAERWLSADEVSFAQLEPTPMGYGLAARPAGEGPLSRAEALAQARTRDAARTGGAP
jgi:hypothetical protein